MANLKYVCISDLHSGAATSLATSIDPDTMVPQYDKISRVARSFVHALRGFMENRQGNQADSGVESDAHSAPQLVLLGDILDLAFSDRENATEVFLKFLTPLMQISVNDTSNSSGQECLFNENLIIIPGNHDHSLWTSGRYAYEAHTASKQTAGSGNLGLIDATSAFSNQPIMQSPLIESIGKRIGLNGNSDLRYPNFGAVNSDRKKSVVFHHGHFIESTYRAMSAISDALSNKKRPEITVGELSKENANWIDFGWSSFGDAANVGADVTALYQYLLTGSEAQKLKNRAAKLLEEMVAGKMPMGGEQRVQHIVRMVMSALIDSTFGAYSDQERYSQIEYLSAGSLESLNWYVGGPTRRQILDELSSVPENTTFVFGHTHKPFEDQLVVDGFDTPVATCNTGGWMLDAPRLDGKEGASLVFVDDDMNTVSVRLFQTSMDASFQPGAARLVSVHDESGKQFLSEVTDILQQTQSLWESLAEVASEEYLLRQQLILHKTHETDLQAEQAGAIL